MSGGQRYHAGFAEEHGIQIMREERERVHLSAWKPVPASLRRRLEALHGRRVVIHRGPRTSGGRWAVIDSEASAETGAGDGLDRLRNLSPADEAIHALMDEALQRGASDCSMWPADELSWMVSLRIRGTLKLVGMLPDPLAQRVVRRMLMRAGLDLLDEHGPQDGMLPLPWFPGRRFRLAVVGAGRRRVVSVRLLARRPPPPPALGYPASSMVRILGALRARAGLILFSGPTGSGKTTGMAAFVALLADGARKIVTLEDPVEYVIPRAVQVERGLRQTATLMAAVMRQDPDVLVLGETREPSQAAQLEQAVLSGHLVVSGVHARGVDGVRKRMLQLGATPELLAHHGRLLVDQSLHHGTLRVTTTAYPWAAGEGGS